MTTRDKDPSDKKMAKMRADQELLRREVTHLRKENHEVKKTLNQREALLNSFPVGYVLLEKSKIMEANEFLLNQLRYSSEEVLGRHFTDLVHPRLRNVMKDFQRRRVSGKWAPEEYETDLVSKNGEILSCDVRVKKVHRSGRTAFLLVFNPSEERKKREKALVESKKRESLARMAREMWVRFQPPGEELAALAQNSKQVRDPERPVFGQVEGANSQISRVFKSLENFSRETPDPLKRSLVDLKKVAREAVAFVSPMLKAYPENQRPGINLKTYLRSVSPVEGDAEEIEEMLSQVMSNAVEAMPQGGDLYLSIEENAGDAHIYVQDRGMGIAPELLDKVFDPFFTTKQDGSPGLGLSVAQAIARRHQGTLELSSKEKEGTMVTIRLPLAAPSPKKPRRRKRANEVSILLIEDDLMIRDLLSKMLEHKGYRLSAVSTGAEGLQHLKKKSFDMVIVGSETPGINAQSLIREIKKKFGLRVAWITAGEAKESKGKERDPAADLLIRKPIDMTSTLEKLSRLLAG